MRFFRRESISAEWVYKRAPWAILGLGLAMRLAGLDKGIWLDEFSSVNRIIGADFLHDLRTYDHPPLYLVLLRLWSRIAIQEEFLRLLSVLFGVATLAVVMAWVKQYARAGSLIAGLCCATWPMMLRYSQEIRGYSLLLFGVALAFFFVTRLASAPDKTSGYAGLAFSLSIVVASHAVGIMLLVSICLWAAATPVLWKKENRGRVLVAMALPVAVFIFLFFVFLRINKSSAEWWIPEFSAALIASTAKEIFGYEKMMWPWQVIQKRLPFGGEVFEILAKLLMAGFGTALFVLGNWKRSWPLLLAAICYWLQLAAYSVFMLPILWYRTALPGLIPFFGFLGVHVATMAQKPLRIFFTAGIFLICSVFSASWMLGEAWRPYEYWRAGAKALAADLQPHDLVILYPDYIAGPVTYYLALPAEAVAAINLETGAAEIKKRIAAQITRRKDLEMTFSVFLLHRSDLSTQRNSAHLQQLLEILETELGRPTDRKHWDSLTLLRHEHRRLSR